MGSRFRASQSAAKGLRSKVTGSSSHGLARAGQRKASAELCTAPSEFPCVPVGRRNSARKVADRAWQAPTFRWASGADRVLVADERVTLPHALLQALCQPRRKVAQLNSRGRRRPPAPGAARMSWGGQAGAWSSGAAVPGLSSAPACVGGGSPPSQLPPRIISVPSLVLHELVDPTFRCDARVPNGSRLAIGTISGTGAAARNSASVASPSSAHLAGAPPRQHAAPSMATQKDQSVSQGAPALATWPEVAVDAMARSTASAAAESSQASDGHECPICGNIFKLRCNFTQHMRRVHERRKPYACDDCGATFSASGSLRKHRIGVHEQRRDYECTQCSRAFAHAGALRVHIATVHEKRRDFACGECGTAFGIAAHLNRHVQTVHRNRRDFPCSVCGHPFASAAALRSHVAEVHEGRRDHRCEQCGQAFSRMAYLRKHIASLHGAKRGFACDDCKLSFQGVSALRWHRSEAHSAAQKWACGVCQQEHASSEELRAHVVAAHRESCELTCQQCGMFFPWPQALDAHVRTVHVLEREHVCRDCGRGFTRANLLRKHVQTLHRGAQHGLVVEQPSPSTGGDCCTASAGRSSRTDPSLAAPRQDVSRSLGGPS